jgi:hypothetical protein
MSSNLWDKSGPIVAQRARFAGATGNTPVKRQMADNYSDRQTRFYYRGLLRDGIWLGDPLLIPIEVAEWSDPDPDDLS